MAWVRPGRGLGESKATHWHAVMSEVPDITGKKNRTKIKQKIGKSLPRKLEDCVEVGSRDRHTDGGPKTLKILYSFNTFLKYYIKVNI